jgi:DNA-binding HxlR family transcriptional regulator
MMVLGAINNGAKTFDKIRKETQIEYNELNDILENLEQKELMRVERKSGLFGTKVELCATDKGFREYYS